MFPPWDWDDPPELLPDRRRCDRDDGAEDLIGCLAVIVGLGSALFFGLLFLLGCANVLHEDDQEPDAWAICAGKVELVCAAAEDAVPLVFTPEDGEILRRACDLEVCAALVDEAP